MSATRSRRSACPSLRRTAVAISTSLLRPIAPRSMLTAIGCSARSATLMTRSKTRCYVLGAHCRRFAGKARLVLGSTELLQTCVSTRLRGGPSVCGRSITVHQRPSGQRRAQVRFPAVTGLSLIQTTPSALPTEPPVPRLVMSVGRLSNSHLLQRSSTCCPPSGRRLSCATCWASPRRKPQRRWVLPWPRSMAHSAVPASRSKNGCRTEVSNRL
jgi:hypothetical protein